MLKGASDARVFALSSALGLSLDTTYARGGITVLFFESFSQFFYL